MVVVIVKVKYQTNVCFLPYRCSVCCVQPYAATCGQILYIHIHTYKI